MAERTRPGAEDGLMQIEPDDRLVVLARTMQAVHPGYEAEWEDGRGRPAFGETCLGRALYRHRSIFRSASHAPVWSHLELHYFRGILPADAIDALACKQRTLQARLLRAEILVTTPASFIMPQDWRGGAQRPERQASLEFIHVRPTQLGAYRDIMRRSIGPAAARLVALDKIGTFRAMETAAVLYQDPSLTIDWNQIHLSEVDTGSFKGFGEAFDAALREISPDGGFAGIFAALGSLRTIPRWTLNDAVTETDLAIGPSGAAVPPPA